MGCLSMGNLQGLNCRIKGVWPGQNKQNCFGQVGYQLTSHKEPTAKQLRVMKLSCIRTLEQWLLSDTKGETPPDFSQNCCHGMTRSPPFYMAHARLKQRWPRLVVHCGVLLHYSHINFRTMMTCGGATGYWLAVLIKGDLVAVSTGSTCILTNLS